MAKKPKATGNAILDELVEATGAVQKGDESVQDYARRLAQAVDKLADDDWKGMSEPAQLWANDAVVAADAKKEIDLLPGMVDADDDADAGEEPDAEASDAPDDEEPDVEDTAAEGESDDVEEPEPKSAGKKASTKKGEKVSAAKKPAAVKQVEAKSADKKAKESEKSKKSVAKPADKKAKRASVAKPASKASGKKAAVDKKPKKVAVSDANGKAKPHKPSAEPRAGTKLARLIKLITRTRGATLEEIMNDLGWVSHTVRGVIARHVRGEQGLDVTAVKTKRGTVYCIGGKV